MLKNSFSIKKTINNYIMMFIIIIIILVAIFLMLKYSVEGEKNLPFEISSIKVLSTATSDAVADNEEDIWSMNLIQNNDLYITIAKNNDYKKEEVIKTVEFNNFNITKQKENGTTNIYTLNSETNKYIYRDEYIKEAITYTGSNSTNLGLLSINNQGGTIGFSIATINLGEVVINKNQKIKVDGTILQNIGLTQEDIKFNISFDMIIKTESGHNFKTTINLNLPEESVLQDGVSKTQEENMKKIVFKRI